MKNPTLILLLLLLLASCTPLAADPTSTIGTLDIPTSTATPRPTPTPKPKLELPVRDGQSMPPSTYVINKYNIFQLKKLAVWGKGVITALGWSEDGHRIIIDTSLAFLEYDTDSLTLTSEKSRRQLKPPKISLTIEGNTSNYDDFKILVSETSTSKQLGSFEGSVDWGWVDAQYLPESNVIVVERQGYSVQLRDGSSFEIIDQTAYEGGSYSTVVAVSADRASQAIGDLNGAILLKTGEGFLNTMKLDAEGPVGWLSFSPDGSKLASEADGIIMLWETASGKKVGTLPVTFLSGDFFVPNTYRRDFGAGYVTLGGNQLAYTNGGLVNIIDLRNGTRITSFNFSGGIHDIFFSSNARQLIAVMLYDNSYVWDIGQNQIVKTMQWQKNYLTTTVYSPTYRTLLMGDANSGDIEVWNVTNGEVVKSIRAWKSYGPRDLMADGTKSLAISPDGTLALSWSALEGVANLWQIRSPGKIMSIPIPASEYSKYRPRPYPVTISPDNKRLMLTYSLDPDSSLASFYSIPDGHLLYQISCDYATFSQDGSLLVTTLGHNIWFYDPLSGSKLDGWVDKRFEHGYQLLYFSEDGTMLIAVSTSGVITVWGIPYEP